MDQERSDEMIRVAYFFARYDATRLPKSSTVPPDLAELGITSRTKAIDLFWNQLGEGRSETTFNGSMKGDIKYMATALKNNERLRHSRQQAIGTLLTASDHEVWDAVKIYLDDEFFPTPSENPDMAIYAIEITGIDLEIPPETTLDSQQRPFILPDEVDSATDVYVEGAVKSIIVNAYERDLAARRACIEAHGYKCCVCEFSLADKYGEVAEGYIHVHHLRPLSEVGNAHEVDPIKDLCPVCPNCHAVIHRKIPAYTIEDVRAFLRKI